MPKNTVKFPPNVPVHQLALESTDGEQIAPDLYVYDLCDGRQMYINTALALELRRAEIRPGEQFSVCWKWSGDRAEAGNWVVWLTGDSERRRAVEEAEDPETMERTLQRSLERAAKKQMTQGKAPTSNTPRPVTPNRPEEQPPHTALSVISDRKKSQPQEPIPAEEALHQIMCMTRIAAEKAGERWSEYAIQKMCSTVFIWAGSKGIIGRWRTPEAESKIA